MTEESARPRPARPAPPARPRWVKILAVVALLVLAAVVLMLLTGVHNGPGRHLSSVSVVALALGGL